MIKTVLKIDGMMCGMCESHMNDVVRKSCSPKKVNSSAKNGETVVISEAPLLLQFVRRKKAPFQKFISFWKSASETVFSIFYL